MTRRFTTTDFLKLSQTVSKVGCGGTRLTLDGHGSSSETGLWPNFSGLATAGYVT